MTDTRETKPKGEVNPTAVLVTVCLGVAIIGLTSTSLNTAIGVIAEDFDMSTTTVAWTINGYLIAAATLVAAAGQFGDLFGRRKMFLIGTVLFAIGSVTAAISPGSGVFIAARVLQGFGAALMMPAQLALLRLVYPPEKQGTALGIWAAMASLTFAIGPLWGGVFAGTVGWRWMFWFDLVFIAAILLSALRSFPPIKEKLSDASADYLGAGLLAGAILFMVVVFQQGTVWGWTSPKIIFSGVVSVILLIVFWFVEHHVEAPLVHFSLFRNNSYLGGVVTTFAQGVGMLGMLYLVSVFVESFALFDYTPFQAGLVLLPAGLMMFGGALVAGRIADKTGYRVPVTAAMATIAVAALAFLTIDTTSGIALIAGITAIMGLGAGAGFSTTSAAGMASVPERVSGEAAGVINVARYMGTVLIVGLGTSFSVQASTNHLNQQLEAANVQTSEVSTMDDAMRTSSQDLNETIQQLPQDQRKAAQTGVETATVAGFKASQMLTAVIAGLAAIASWILFKSEGKLRKGR